MASGHSQEGRGRKWQVITNDDKGVVNVHHSILSLLYADNECLNKYSTIQMQCRIRLLCKNPQVARIRSHFIARSIEPYNFFLDIRVVMDSLRN